jgi:hypothetical protein
MVRLLGSTLFAVAILCGIHGFADDARPTPLTLTLSHPGDDAAPTATATDSSSIAKIRNLIEAAQHLEAAGAVDLARQARQQVKPLVEAEQARLDREQKELTALCGELATRQIMIQALIVEVPGLTTENLTQLVSRLEGSTTFSKSNVSAMLPDGQTSAFVRALHHEHPATSILSRPQILANDGQVAEISIGSTASRPEGVKIEHDKVVPVMADVELGILVSIVPKIVSDQQTLLEVTFDHKAFDGTKVPILADANSGQVIESPICSSRRLQATVKAESGKTVVLMLGDDREAVDATGKKGPQPTNVLLLTPHVLDAAPVPDSR